ADHRCGLLDTPCRCAPAISSSPSRAACPPRAPQRTRPCVRDPSAATHPAAATPQSNRAAVARSVRARAHMRLVPLRQLGLPSAHPSPSAACPSKLLSSRFPHCLAESVPTFTSTWKHVVHRALTKPRWNLLLFVVGCSCRLLLVTPE